MSTFGIIYKAINKVNGKIYIGQTTHMLEDRIDQHYKKGSYFYRALTKYSRDVFSWQILEHCDSKEELDEMEFHYIKQYNALSPKGYNLTLGGEGVLGRQVTDGERKKISDSLKIYFKNNDNPNLGRKHSDESKKKMSDSLKGRFCKDKNPFYGKKHTELSKEKMSKSLMATNKHPNRGKHLSEEWKRKISLSNKGRIVSEEMRMRISATKMGKFAGPNSPFSKKFVITKPDGSLFVIHGLYNFSKNYKLENLDFRLLSAVARGKRNHHKGYKCRYFDKSKDINLEIWS